MENAADALKIAFAVFIFVIVITITFTIISQAKSTADSVFYHSDETNFYEYVGSTEKNRKVLISEIIPTLYRYYEESIGVTVNLNYGKTYTFDLNNSEYFVDDDDGRHILNGSETFDREKNLEKFINDKLLGLPSYTKFEEEFVEIPISGIYEYGSDGTELAISSGGKKVYITYTQQ